MADIATQVITDNEDLFDLPLKCGVRDIGFEHDPARGVSGCHLDLIGKKGYSYQSAIDSGMIDEDTQCIFAESKPKNLKEVFAWVDGRDWKVSPYFHPDELDTLDLASCLGEEHKLDSAFFDYCSPMLGRNYLWIEDQVSRYVRKGSSLLWTINRARDGLFQQASTNLLTDRRKSYSPLERVLSIVPLRWSEGGKIADGNQPRDVKRLLKAKSKPDDVTIVALDKDKLERSNLAAIPLVSEKSTHLVTILKTALHRVTVEPEYIIEYAGGQSNGSPMTFIKFHVTSLEPSASADLALHEKLTILARKHG